MEKKYVAFRAEQELYDKLRELAAREHRSMGAQIKHMIECQLKEYYARADILEPTPAPESVDPLR